MNVDTIRADFDEIARLGDQYPSGADRYDRFVQLQVPVDARRILDVGCGTGRLMFDLAAGGRECVGVDLSREMIRRATEDPRGRPALTFLCGDFMNVALRSHGFDCVVSMAALHHMPEDPAVSRMKQLLRPRGRLIIHDLRTSSGLVDEVTAWTVLAYEAGQRFLRTGWPLSPGPVRRAWAKHGARERYLTLDEVNALANRLLPGARVFKHRGWRYTIVLDNPPT